MLMQTTQIALCCIVVIALLEFLRGVTLEKKNLPFSRKSVPPQCDAFQKGKSFDSRELRWPRGGRVGVGGGF